MAGWQIIKLGASERKAVRCLTQESSDDTVNWVEDKPHRKDGKEDKSSWLPGSGWTDKY